MNQLFADGGIVGHNPSALGDTWAYRILAYDQIIKQASGSITPEQARVPAITNNLTEMIAVIRGFQALPADWRGQVLSDSQITLGRIFQGWKWHGIPLWLHHEFQAERKRLINFESLEFFLLQGHPTKAELAAGIGSRGYPVSEHNVWADKACGKEALKLKESFLILRDALR
jgi:hypothetical protein